MGEKLTTAVVSVLLAIVGVAIIAVLVSNNAQTGSVIGAAGKGFSNALACALSPITGKACTSLTENVTSSISFN